MPSGLRRRIGGLAAVALVVGLSLVAGRGGSAGDVRVTPETVPVTAHAIPHFRRGDENSRSFGPLEYLGGVELHGRHHGFGGLSSIRLRPDGESFVAVTDTGDWITGRITEANGAPTGLADVRIAPILMQDGRRARDVRLWDAESLALDGDMAFVGIEREHTILAFDIAAVGGDIAKARGRALPLPSHIRDWPENRGIEALGIVPAGPYAGRLIGIAERSHEFNAPATEGFVMRRDGGEPFRFRLRTTDGFDVTSLAFLPDGDMLVLERFFSPRRGVAMRIKRVRMADVGPDKTVDGEILITADNGFHIDNMEGLAVHRNARGETLLTVISDDNFSIAQRTLLLRFQLVERR